MQIANKQRLNREDWLYQALEVLVAQGPARLNIQNLCQALGVSRGSFYWHFADREAFIHDLLDLWHHEYTARLPDLIEAEGGTGREKFERLVYTVFDKGLTHYDLPIRSWAMLEPDIAERLHRTDEFRMEYVSKLLAEMGFSGIEREARARVAIAALTMQKNFLYLGNDKKPAAIAALFTSIICGE